MKKLVAALVAALFAFGAFAADMPAADGATPMKTHADKKVQKKHKKAAHKKAAAAPAAQ
jgi:hypothetical protein